MQCNSNTKLKTQLNKNNNDIDINIEHVKFVFIINLTRNKYKKFKEDVRDDITLIKLILKLDILKLLNIFERTN